MATYRGGSERRLHHIEGLTSAEAKHWLLHSAPGRTLLRDSGTDIDTLANHLVEASGATNVNKQNEVSTMTSTTRILKNVKHMGEAAYTKVITDYAKQQYPDLTRERAFAKVFEAPDAEGQAIRHFWSISKGNTAPLDEPDDDNDEIAEAETRRRLQRARRQGPAPRDADEADAAGRRVVSSALGQLNVKAAEYHKAYPKLTKEQAFAKVYTDPENVALVRQERADNAPRAA